ncbi:deoxyribonuclease IV, partial [bacterium]|nr:deoxyribonuclease IV [bacterium]
KTAGRLLSFKKDDIAAFLELRKKHFGDLFLHASYWVNLAGVKQKKHPLLEKEIAFAKQLGFTHVVMHAGSAKGARNKKESIDALARSVDWLINQDCGLPILLENVAHGGNAVGNDLNDFRDLLKLIDQPQKLNFCIDTVHAFLFGYDISNNQKQDDFINRVDDIMGWSNVGLIHLNDTQEKMGSKIDKHYVVGQGNIGDDALKRFILHEKIKTIPIIMEVPMLSEEQQKALLKKVRDWHSK